MCAAPVDLNPLRNALGQLDEALHFWHAQAANAPLARHLRAAVIQAFEFSYELSVRMLRRVLMEQASAAEQVAALSFNDLMRSAADAGLLPDPLAWRRWREMRNATSHAYDEARAQAVAQAVGDFLPEARRLLHEMERRLG
jgi:nucleotidyltransferase substrate binding protein (TIGR01987 family)